MNYKPNNHIIGKVYDLTQENMNAMLEHIEQLRIEHMTSRQLLFIAYLVTFIAGVMTGYNFS